MVRSELGKLTLARLSQHSNALSPMLVTPEPREHFKARTMGESVSADALNGVGDIHGSDVFAPVKSEVAHGGNAVFYFDNADLIRNVVPRGRVCFREIVHCSASRNGERAARKRPGKTRANLCRRNGRGEQSHEQNKDEKRRRGFANIKFFCCFAHRRLLLWLIPLPSP